MNVPFLRECPLFFAGASAQGLADTVKQLGHRGLAGRFRTRDRDVGRVPGKHLLDTGWGGVYKT